MKKCFLITLGFLMAGNIFCQQENKALPKKSNGNKMFIDVHELGAGKVSFNDVMNAHKKDLATQGKYGVNFIKFWVDELNGKVYCLSTAKNKEAVTKTHAEAHGLLPSQFFLVKEGIAANEISGKSYFIDVHNVGAGKVNAKAVAGAHLKDLATQGKYGVNFINYWLDEKKGTILCLSQAPDSLSIVNTHREAHGLLPEYVEKVKQGQ